MAPILVNHRGQDAIENRGSLDSDGSTFKGSESSFQIDKKAAFNSVALTNLGPERTNLGNTGPLFMFLSEAWIIHCLVILTMTYCLCFLVPQGYSDTDLWNYTCWGK